MPTFDTAGHSYDALLTQTQAASQAREERFRALVEYNADIIALLDGDGHVLYVSQAVNHILGVPQHKWIGDALIDHAVSDDREAFRKLLAGARANPELPVRAELRMMAEDGVPRTLEVVLTNRLHQPTLGVIVCNAADVTRQREMQVRLQLSDRMASIGTLAAGVAHEINNPLAVIVGNLDLLASQFGPRRADAAPATPLPDATVYEILQDASEAADRVRLIVRDLKLFSRGEDQTSGPVDVLHLIDSSLRMTWNEVRHHARVVKDLIPVAPILGNEARLGQVLVNLLINAAQAIPEGHAAENEIHIASRMNAQGDVVIEIRDSGCGIPAEILPRIFDPFFTTKAVGVGTGLGLAICHRIVTESGGTIRVDSRVGAGTTFQLTLPAAAAAVTDKPGTTVVVNAGATSSAPAAVRTARRRGRVLVVDDEPLIRSFVTRALRDAHDVISDTCADDALERLREGARFDAILCDVMMPQTTGIDFLNAVAELAPDQAARIVFITGGAFTGRTRTFVENTPRPLIDKPFDPRMLRMLVDQMVR